LSCTSCHGDPPSTGKPIQGSPNAHAFHVTTQGFACSVCHPGFTSTAVNAGLHVNGTKNVGGTGTQINSWNSGTTSCGPNCHATETWR